MNQQTSRAEYGEETQETVSGLLLRLEQESASNGSVSIEVLQEISGHRVSGPMLLVPGLVAVSPLSGIPTLPTILGTIVALVCIQILWGRKHLWFPRKLRNASLSGEQVLKIARFLRTPARYLDKFSQPRLVWLTKGLPARMAAAVCLVAALSMPPLEVLPFSATLAGTVIAAFGLSLTTRDGALMIAVFALFGMGAWGIAAIINA